MSTQVQWRGGTTAENNAFTGASREITVDTTLKELRVHDGVTPGGTAVARKSVVDAHIAASGNPHGLAAADIGLGNVNNTSDANKPVSVAQAAAIAAVNDALDARLDALEADVWTKSNVATNAAIAHNQWFVIQSAGLTITLPGSPVAGVTQVRISTGASVNTVLARNGLNIRGVADNLTLDMSERTITFIYADATRGWQIIGN